MRSYTITCAYCGIKVTFQKESSHKFKRKTCSNECQKKQRLKSIKQSVKATKAKSANKYTPNLESIPQRHKNGTGVWYG